MASGDVVASTEFTFNPGEQVVFCEVFQGTFIVITSVRILKLNIAP